MLKSLISSLPQDIQSESEQKKGYYTNAIDALRISAASRYPDIRKASDKKAAGNISEIDAQILYALVRNFKPKTIFEIGTWIGTSSMVMADALKENGPDGHIYTCDSNKYYTLNSKYDDRITTINQYSDKALDQVPLEHSIDFVFADGELTTPTLKKLIPRLSEKAIIVTHDFTRPGEKGVRNLIRSQQQTGYRFSYILPKGTNDIESTIGILVPDEVGAAYPSLMQTKNSRKLFTIHLFLTANTYLLIRRIYRKLTT